MITEWPNGHSMLREPSSLSLSLNLPLHRDFGADCVNWNWNASDLSIYLISNCSFERLKRVWFAFGLYWKNGVSIGIRCVNAVHESESADDATLNANSSSTNNITIHPSQSYGVGVTLYPFPRPFCFTAALGENGCAVQNEKRNNNE